MTLSSAVNRNDYTGNGATSVYSYTFRIFAATDLLVTVRNTTTNVETTLVLNTNYTVAGVGLGAGGSITLLGSFAPLTSGHLLTIRRVRPFTQTTDIRNQGDFLPESHEDAFDHQVMLTQQLDDAADRSLKLPETETGVAATTVLPSATQRASRLLGFDASGNLVVEPTVATVGSIGGSGTIHVIPKFASGSTIADGPITIGAGNTTLTYSPSASTTGAPVIFGVVGPTHTGLTAGAGLVDVYFQLSRAVTRATGNVSLDQIIRIEPPQLAFVGASTVTEAATVYINGAPTAGANCTITNAYGLLVNGNTRIGNLRVGLGLRLDPVTHAELTADQNNLALGGATNSTFVRMSSDASRNVTGLVSGSANTDGQTLIIVNHGSQNIVFQNQNASSTAGNRIITGTGADITLAPDDTLMLIYDGTTARWRVLNTH